MNSYPDNLAYNENRLDFTFTIKGRNGREQKKVKFSKTEHLNAYNLALGTIKENGKVDYSEITNSGDLVRLFSTIINCIELFLEKHPEQNIFFTGDTEQKTKVYQEILRRHYHSFSEKYHIFGIIEDEYTATIELFDSSKKYSGFIIKSK